MRLAALMVLTISFAYNSIASAQTIAIDPAHPTRLTITTAPAKEGDSVFIYSAKTAGSCGIGASPLHLFDHLDAFVGEGSTTNVELDAPLPPNAFICVLISSKDSKAVTVGQEFATSAPPPDPSIETAPAVGDDTLAIVTAPAKPGALIKVYDTPHLDKCETKKLLTIVDNKLVRPGDTVTRVMMQDMFVAKQYVCVILDPGLTSKPVAVVAKSAILPDSPPTQDAAIVKPSFQGRVTAGSSTVTLAGQTGTATAAPATDPKATVAKATNDATTAAAASSGAEAKSTAAAHTAAEANTAASAAKETANTASDTAAKISVAADTCKAQSDATKADVVSLGSTAAKLEAVSAKVVVDPKATPAQKKLAAANAAKAASDLQKAKAAQTTCNTLIAASEAAATTKSKTADATQTSAKQADTASAVATQAGKDADAAKAAAAAADKTAADAKATVILSVYEFPGTFLSNAVNEKDCSADIGFGTPLSIVSGTTTGYNTSAPSTSPYALTLSQPLTSGTALCVTQTINGVTLYSALAPVTDPTDYGRFTAIFTAGAIVSNQQQSSNSTTAGEYLDMKLNNSWVIGGRRPCAAASKCKSSTQDNITTYYQGKRFAPGFDSYFDARLSQIPVSTSTQTVAQGTTTSNLNLLTSQQGLKVMIGGNLPFRTSGWNKRSNAFTIGPAVKASFDTLLNPTVSSGSSSSPTTGNFSSVYHSWAAGLRSSWDQFPASTDKSPKTLAEFEVLLGEYSNLPSYECTGSKGKGGPIPSGSVSSCPAMTNVSRTLIPRIDIAGFVNFPGYPFVFGFDANLAQYALPHTPGNIDILNKPGNDVRIYIGYTIDLATAFKMLKK